jgi:hypothetical protein
MLAINSSQSHAGAGVCKGGRRGLAMFKKVNVPVLQNIVRHRKI